MIKKNGDVSLFLDSGAYSAFTQDIEINIDDYIQYIKDNRAHISQYASLDVIGDEQATLDNYKHMKEHDLEPIPTYHYGDKIKYLEYYLSNNDYIALGGLVGD